MIPEEFKWLLDIKDCILEKALDYYDVTEYPGEANNPLIISMARETGKKWYTEDKLDWCGVFISFIVDACGFEIPEKSNRSLSWIDWGEEVTEPRPGDIIIFKKEGIRGHIGLYIAEEGDFYWVLGGNQSKDGKDSVNIKKIKKRKFVTIRRPIQNQQINKNETSQNKEDDLPSELGVPSV